MVLSESQTYAIGVVVAGLFLLVALVRLRKFEREQRTQALPFAGLSVLLLFGYIGMSQGLLAPIGTEGYPVHLLRYSMYVVGYGFAAGYTGLLARAPLRYRLAIVGAVIGNTISTAGGQLIPGAAGSLLSLLSIVSLGAALWVLLGPLTSAAQTVSGRRRLLFSKLRNIFILGFLTYFLTGLLARGTLGIFDTFVSVFVAGYADIIIFGGLILIPLTSPGALETMAEEYRSPLAVFARSTDGVE
ncbi:bacteriorhodopsin [Halovenus halobia]|uniref:bacteriorhodopsin n=1 Tax=Halovenus halobia TaxID=3396622 RepID=UPI003F57F5B6